MILMQLSGRTCTLSLCTASPSCWHWAQHHPPGVTGHSTTLLLSLCTASPSWCHSAQHHPPAGTGDWLLQLPVCPVCLAEQCPGRGHRELAAPLSQEKDTAAPHPWEAPGGSLLCDPGQKQPTKDSVNAAFLPHSLWMGNSLLTVPKSYRDPLNINFHIPCTSEPLCNAAPPHPPPLLWSTQLHLRQDFPISRAPCPVTHALGGQDSAGNCL